jgi:hypothetical protein
MDGFLKELRNTRQETDGAVSGWIRQICVRFGNWDDFRLLPRRGEVRVTEAAVK